MGLVWVKGHFWYQEPKNTQTRPLPDPFQGLSKSVLTPLELRLGNGCYKVRLAIASKGKSGGARVIANLVIEESSVFLLAIYDKSEKENLTNSELADLLSQFNQWYSKINSNHTSKNYISLRRMVMPLLSAAFAKDHTHSFSPAVNIIKIYIGYTSD
ncbi:MAG: type II toxin-antitoxin system RelE/ParE family toxin [Pedobacter sp.]|nr:type II toxin-antitoxin system RelE/ParE family toxin [Pedobacter sp.]